MGKFIDLTGQTFGRLTVIELSHVYKGTHWLVECSCGITKVVSGWHLRGGKTRSCGCIRRLDLSGQVFGRLTVTSFSHRDEQKNSHWVCQCKCGKTLTVFGIALKSGHTRSCGCLQKEEVSKRRLKDLSGQVFGRLTAIKIDHMSKSGNACWLVECSCGKIKVVAEGSLVSGDTLSCGCYRREHSSKLNLTDLEGKEFGRFLVIGRAKPLAEDGAYWNVLCSCGKSKVVKGSSLISGRSKSCGCLRVEKTISRSTTHGLSHTKAWKYAYDRVREEKKKSLDVQWTPLMELCLRDYQPACVVCGSTYMLSVDHVLPLSKGNGLYPGNSVILCKRHNSIKYNKSLDQLPIEMAAKIREAAESFRVAWSGGF